MSDHYHDDPVEISEPKSKKLPAILAFILFVIAGGNFLQTTLAASINLNSGDRVEFGTGSSIVAACSQGSALTVIPKSEFVNASGAGDHYIKSIQVSGIPASCNGKDFNISLYNNTPNSDPLPIFESTKNVATVYSNDGTFQQGYQGTGSIVSSTSGGFTITFATPAALSSNATKFVLQSSDHRDWFTATISASQYHTCASLSSGGAKCWGDNGQGQLGDGTNTERRVATDVSGLTSGVVAISTSNGEAHTCAVLNTGAVKCWGYNNFGQLGDGTTTGRNTPVDVSGLSSGVSAIAAGFEHSCALLKTGAVKCWGRNDYGQLGDNSTTQRLTPVNVSGLSSGVTAISTGKYHTCALLNTGGVKCWGNSSFGERGNGTIGTNLLTPGDVTGLTSGVTAISLGYFHSCAVLNTGAAKCWGWNLDGQIGDGTSGVNRGAPTTVTGLSGVISISGSSFNTCAVLNTGAAKCWGRNQGRFGDGTTTSSTTPVNVSGLSSGVTAISTGEGHTCALLISGAVKCWGDNYSGQVGNGAAWNVNSLTPATVLGIP
ncbi:MAG: biotin transporter BioY [Actinomycetes bacterium]